MLGPALLVLVAWGALAFGAVYPWAYWPLAAASAVIGVWGLVATDAANDPRTVTLSRALGVLALAITLQVVPWPASFTNWLSPHLTPFFQRSQFGYAQPAYQPLTVSPALTMTVLGLFVALALLLLGLSRFLRSVPLDRLMSGLMGIGVTLAFIGIIQKGLIDEDQPLVYGFWKPIDGGRVFGPFINRNHFAGWMAMALPVLIGYSCGVVSALRPPREHSVREWLHWASGMGANRFVLAVGAILVMAASLVLTQSRSGMLAFAAGIAVIAVTVVRRSRSRAVRISAIVYFTLLFCAAVAWAGMGSTITRIAMAPEHMQGRIGAWQDATRIIRDFPVAGTGMGTFGQAMLVYQTGRRELMYMQAHNDYLQVAAEGGLLVGLPALAVIGLLGAGIRRRLTSSDDDVVTAWTRVGAVAALVSIGVQSAMEFSLQMPGNAVMFVCVAALAMHRPRRSSRAHRI